MKAQENSDVIGKRKEKLEKTDAFRVYEGRHKLGQRADKAKWSNEIHEIDSFPAPGKVQDTKGKEFLTKLTKPVPKDSSALASERQYDKRGSAQTDDIRRTALQPYVQRLLPLVANGMRLEQLTKKSRTVSGFADELKKQSTNMKGFL